MQKPTQRIEENEESGEYVPNNNNNKDKSPESDLNEMKVSDLFSREFKIMVIKMLIEVREQCMNKVIISTYRKY